MQPLTLGAELFPPVVPSQATGVLGRRNKIVTGGVSPDGRSAVVMIEFLDEPTLSWPEPYAVMSLSSGSGHLSLMDGHGYHVRDVAMEVCHELVQSLR